MASVIAVSLRHGHHFSKTPSLSIRLLTGLGVAGDAHMGETVKHRSRVRKDPTQPNLRQVHLIHAELFDELRGKGFAVRPGDLGENVTTSGIDLLALPTDTRLHIRGGRSHGLTQSLRPDRRLSKRPDGRDPGQGRRRQSDPQGRHHEHRARRWRRAAGRRDPGRTARGAQQAAATCVIANS
jgi:hypothetical protein